jgi:mRNA interferase MazF
MLKKVFQKGDIWLVNLNYYKIENQTSRQYGIRPMVITSSEIANLYSPIIDATPVTSNLEKNNLPVHVFISKECGLLNDSLALVEQDQPVDKSCFFRLVGRCTPEIMNQIDRAIMLQKQITAMPVNITMINQYIKAIEEARYYNVVTGIENTFILETLLGSLKEYCEVCKLDIKSLLLKRNINIVEERSSNNSLRYAFA